MTFEEIKLKLGIDNSQVGPGLEDFKGKTKNAFEAFSHHQANATKGAGALHKALEKIGDYSPTLATIIQGVFNPVAGAIAAATAAFAYFQSQIEKANEELDKMAAENIKPLWDIAEIFRTAYHELVKLNDEFDRWSRGKDKTASKVDEGVRERIDGLKAEQTLEQRKFDIEKQRALMRIANDEKSGRIGSGEAVNRRNMVEKNYAWDTHALQVNYAQKEYNVQKEALNKLASEALKASDEVAAAFANASYAGSPKLIEGTKRKISQYETKTIPDAQKKYDEAKAAKEAYEAEHPDEIQEHYGSNKFKSLNEDFKDAGQSLNGFKEKLKKSQEWLDVYQTAQERSADKLKESQEKLDSINDGYNKTSEAVEKARNALELAKATPAGYTVEQLKSARTQLLPTVDELAKSGSWSYNRLTHRSTFHPGPFAGIANRIENLQTDAVQSAIYGNRGRHDADVMEVNRLKGMLREAGVIDPGDAQIESSKSLATIADALTDGKAIVTVKNTD